MYVTTPCGCFRFRTASAARPRSNSEASLSEPLPLGGAQSLAVRGAREERVERRVRSRRCADRRRRSAPVPAEEVRRSRRRRRSARDPAARRPRGRSESPRGGRTATTWTTTPRAPRARRRWRRAARAPPLLRRQEALVAGGQRALRGRTMRRRRTASPVQLPPGASEVEHVRKATFDLERRVADDERAARVPTTVAIASSAAAPTKPRLATLASAREGRAARGRRSCATTESTASSSISRSGARRR